jgi:hypothetical protein
LVGDFLRLGNFQEYVLILSDKAKHTLFPE